MSLASCFYHYNIQQVADGVSATALKLGAKVDGTMYRDVMLTNKKSDIKIQFL